MIKFYTTGCPKCRVLKDKLDFKGIQYETVQDVNEMIAKGMKSAPALEIDGELLDFPSAIKWLNERD